MPGGGVDRKSPLRGAALAVLALLALATPASAAQPVKLAASASASTRPVEDLFTFGNPAFCAPVGPVEDFGLSKLPPAHEPPATGDIPFGPKTVSLSLFLGPILLPGESIGVWLDSQNFIGRTPLRWALRSRIRALDEAGDPGKVLSRARLRIRTINAGTDAKAFVRPPRELGSYRYEIEIARFDGKRLARYGKNVKVERRFWNPKLGLSRHVLNPGQKVLSRVENHGTERPVFGEEYGIQRWTGESWIDVRNPSQNGWLLWQGLANPGWSGQCSALRLPRDFPLGQYRIVKEVERLSLPEGRRSSYLTASFEVVPAGP